MNLVVLGLGSNMSLCLKDGSSCNSEEILMKACGCLEKHLTDMHVSSIYKTKPRYVENQSDFFNMVVSGLWGGSPRELLTAIQKIEYQFGRNREGVEPKGPRTLDIDIELFGEQIIREEDKLQPLFVPHPLMNERQFVLVPLLEILPDSADPITRQPFSKILSGLPDQGVVLWKHCKTQKQQHRIQ